mgnify:CR=1 FL=1
MFPPAGRLRELRVGYAPERHARQRCRLRLGRGIAGRAPRGLRAPLRRDEYQEGGNLAYLLRMGGHEVLIMGSMNYIEREMVGLRPDIALVGSNSQRLEVFQFTGRLMKALGNPAVVIPTHADAYGDPKPSAAALADPGVADALVLKPKGGVGHGSLLVTGKHAGTTTLLGSFSCSPSPSTGSSTVSTRTTGFGLRLRTMTRRLITVNSFSARYFISFST